MSLALTHKPKKQLSDLSGDIPERTPRKRCSNLQHSNTPSLQHSNLLVLSVLILTCVFYFASAIAAHGATQSSGSAATAKATFAGGCFWCMEPPYDELDGVLSTISGYMGGTKKNPTYEEVSSGRTGHAEIVQITYDPKKITYSKLLEVFWRNIDPLTPNAQFCDSGSQYRSAIFYHDENQKRLAQETQAALSKRFKEPIVTEIVPASTFYPAEDYHQDYYKKNPIRYKLYRHGCGRDQRLKELWGAADK